MSEKAACPRCDAYLSVIYYEGRHPDCGWNCNVRYEIHVDDYNDGVREVAVTGIRGKPSEALRDQVRRAAVTLGIENPELRVVVRVDDYVPERLTAWLDPNAETPQPIPQRRQRANLKALRDRYEEQAREEIAARLPS